MLGMGKGLLKTGLQLNFVIRVNGIIRFAYHLKLNDFFIEIISKVVLFVVITIKLY